MNKFIVAMSILITIMLVCVGVLTYYVYIHERQLGEHDSDIFKLTRGYYTGTIGEEVR